MNSKMARRTKSGNTLVMIAAVTILVLMALVFLILNYGGLVLSYGKHLNACEASALSAATDLSRIVIEDQHFGFISLTDQPPIGRATVARDGQPLPVLGINTVLGTARLDLIICSEIGDRSMLELAKEDVREAKRAAEDLNAALQQALSGQPATDMDGNQINVLATAKAVYLRNLRPQPGQPAPQIEQFDFSLGWLDGGSETITDIPQPQSKNQVPPSAQQDGKYRAFINIPAEGTDFYFAGMGKKHMLVDPKNFRANDGVHPCSIVRLQAKHTVKAMDMARSTQVASVACAQPGGGLNFCPPAQLTIAFPGGYVPGITKIRDLFTNRQLANKPVQYFKPINGDWPTDQGSSITPITSVSPSLTTGPRTVAESFSVGFFDWMRANKTRLRIDDVLVIVDQPFAAVGGAAAGPTAANNVSYTFSGCPGDPQDPRYVSILGNNTAAQTGYMRLTELGPLSPGVPANATAVMSTSGGPLTNPGGSVLSNADLQEFWDELSVTNDVARMSLAIAQQAEADALAGRTGPQYGGRMPDLNLARQAMRNAQFTIDQTQYVADNLATLTGLGLVKKPENLHWELSYPPSVGFGLKQFLMKDVPVNPQSLTQGLPFAPDSPPPFQPPNSMSSPNFQGLSWTETFANSSNYQVWQDWPFPPNAAPPSTPVVTPPTTSSIANVTWRYVVQSDGSIRVVLARTPFALIPVSEFQVWALALDAMETGNAPKMTWVSSVRDQVRFLGRPRGGKHAGQPIAGNPMDYCNNPTYGGVAGTTGTLSLAGNQIASGSPATPLIPQPRNNYLCGGMAVDFQIRAPIVFECNVPPDEVTDDTGASTSLLPEIPPHLF